MWSLLVLAVSTVKLSVADPVGVEDGQVAASARLTTKLLLLAPRTEKSTAPTTSAAPKLNNILDFFILLPINCYGYYLKDVLNLSNLNETSA